MKNVSNRTTGYYCCCYYGKYREKSTRKHQNDFLYLVKIVVALLAHTGEQHSAWENDSATGVSVGWNCDFRGLTPEGHRFHSAENTKGFL